MAGDYPGCGAELRSGGERRACQCVISRPGLGGKWHCDGRHRPGWGDLCVSVSSIPAPQLSSSHFNWSFITGSITLSGHNTTDGDTAPCHHHHQQLLINYTSCYCSTILSKSTMLQCMDLFHCNLVYSFACMTSTKVCKDATCSNVDVKKIKSNISKKNIYNTLITGAPTAI